MPTLTFDYTGSPQYWYVPYHTAGTLLMTVVGARGGTYDVGDAVANVGGYGGAVRGYLDIAPGSLLTIEPGGAGDHYDVFVVVPALGGGGPLPGGDGGIHGSHAYGSVDRYGAGGGGGSRVKVGSTVLAVAGGGGGGGAKTRLLSTRRAPRGALNVGAGSSTDSLGASYYDARPASNGTPGEGGQVGVDGNGGKSGASKYPTYHTDGYPGVAGVGGRGSDRIHVPGSPAGGSNCGGGGGGGGGATGGGGGGGSHLLGRAGGGGGGSSWLNEDYITENPLSLSPYGDGYVTFTWEGDDEWTPQHCASVPAESFYGTSNVQEYILDGLIYAISITMTPRANPYGIPSAPTTVFLYGATATWYYDPAWTEFDPNVDGQFRMSSWSSGSRTIHMVLDTPTPRDGLTLNVQNTPDGGWGWGAWPA